MNKRKLIKNAYVVTMNPKMDCLPADMLIEGNKISEIAPDLESADAEIFDASGLIAVPGFIQTHVHLCQTLFRNTADDLSLLDWLKEKIWPAEAAHNERSLRLSALLGISELFKSGTTTIMDMGIVRHQDVIFEALAASGMRAVAGKIMMDGGDLPSELREDTTASLRESEFLLKKWHGYDDGRIQYAVTPRFAVSSSPELLKEAAGLANACDVIYHSHASENRDECALIEARFGKSNIRVFADLGVKKGNLCLAHCIWTDEADRALMREHEMKVLHCPSANLKLGSGIAPIPDYLDRGISVSLGADGAPCNNNLDIFMEMRLASLIQKPLHGPKTMPAEEIFKSATINAAKTLRQENLIGSLEIGKLADITFIRENQIHSIPYSNIYAKFVYSTRAADVDSVMINGNWVLKQRNLLTMDEEAVISDVNTWMQKSTHQ